MRPLRFAGSAMLMAGLMFVISAPAMAQGPRPIEAQPLVDANRHNPNTFAGRSARVPFGFDEADEIATLEAIRFALTEVADGSSYVWYREHGRLNGLVNPTSSFKDGKGRVCRHMVLIMSAGAQSSKIEGVACRDGSGRWLLEG